MTEKLLDPNPSRRLTPYSITLAPDDLERLDMIMRLYGIKNRSAAVRACVKTILTMAQPDTENSSNG